MWLCTTWKGDIMIAVLAGVEPCRASLPAQHCHSAKNCLIR